MSTSVQRAGPKIIDLRTETNYFGARKLTHQRGLRVISHANLDRHVVPDSLPGTITNDEALRRYFLARELLVSTHDSKKFGKGDFVDEKRGIVVPERCIVGADQTAGVYGKANIGLLIDPELITNERGRQIIHASSASITVVENLVINREEFVFLENPKRTERSVGGKLDEKTGLPIRVQQEVWTAIPFPQQRWVLGEGGVQPLVRAFFHINESGLFTDGWQDPRVIRTALDLNGTFCILAEPIPKESGKPALTQAK
ncbi:MAG: hypothetical protein ABIF01_02735 [Candidatus Micrarchaeota archaeon]